MMYLMSMERGTWGYYELEIAEKLDPACFIQYQNLLSEIF